MSSEDRYDWPNGCQDEQWPPGVGVLRECCAEGCNWMGHTDRMLGAVGPLCPECSEVTEPV